MNEIEAPYTVLAYDMIEKVVYGHAASIAKAVEAAASNQDFEALGLDPTDPEDLGIVDIVATPSAVTAAIVSGADTVREICAAVGCPIPDDFVR